jgi:hypothetical protein
MKINIFTTPGGAPSVMLGFSASGGPAYENQASAGTLFQGRNPTYLISLVSVANSRYDSRYNGFLRIQVLYHWKVMKSGKLLKREFGKRDAERTDCGFRI